MTRRLSMLVVALLALAACSSSGQPTGFDQQPNPVGEELGDALGMDATDTLPVVERNFLEGCVLADTPRITPSGNSAATCECAYDAIVEFYFQRAEDGGAVDVPAEAYSLFRNLNDDLASTARPLPADVLSAVDEAGCTTA